MSWRDRLQPGSFRGIAFFTEQASGTGGRRVAVHEYPLQEEHNAEDLGKAAGSQRLQVYVLGDDYDKLRDQLIDALDAPGPGTLVHPYRGTQRVQIQTYDWSIYTRKGGYCSFTIEYVTAGKRLYPVASTANATALQTGCTSAATTMQSSFSETFSVASQPAFVADTAIDQVTAAADTLRALNGQISSLVQPVNELVDQIDQLSDEVATLVLQPLTLASRVADIIISTIGGINDIATALESYNSLQLGFAPTYTVPTITPARKRQAINQTATANLLLGMATIETARFIARSSAPFTTYNQAIDSRDLLLQQLDSLIETGTDAEYNALVDLQAALMRRVDDVAPGLLHVEQIQLQQSVPALVLAHTLYGDATRADELIQRNEISHPGFMPAGTDLEVLL